MCAAVVMAATAVVSEPRTAGAASSPLEVARADIEVVWTFVPALRSAEADELRARLAPMLTDASLADAQFEANLPGDDHSLSGAFALSHPSQSPLPARFNTLLSSVITRPGVEATDPAVQSRHQALFTDADPFVVTHLKPDGESALRTQEAVVELCLTLQVRCDKAEATASVMADVIPDTPTSAASVSGTGSDVGHGWAPDFGTWYVHKAASITAPQYPGVVVGHEYEWLQTMTWHSQAQLQLLRQADATNNGFEINLAYKAYSGEPGRSGQSAAASDYISDLPGNYRETINIDDNNTVTFAVGSHEAERIQWAYQANPNYLRDYFVIFKITDPGEYASPRPAFTIYGQFDSNMECASDACFNLNPLNPPSFADPNTRSGNFMQNTFCAYNNASSAIGRWDYRTTPGSWRCP